MKCPKCGAVVDGKGICSTCDTATQPASEKFDVTYKTFGAAELLEIGPRKKEAGPGRQTQTSDKTTAKPKPERPLRQERAPAGKKMVFIAAAAIMLLVLLAGIFFWFSYSRR